MTVREAKEVMGNAEIHLVWNGFIIPFEPDNVLMVDAYGSYKVHHIGAGHCRKNNNDGCIEVHIAMQPIKEVRT